MSNQKVFVLLPSDAQELLAENEIDLVRELQRQGLDVQSGYGRDPASGTADRSREVVLVILASAAAATALSGGIVRILDALGRNRRFVAQDVRLAPVIGPDEKLVHTADGNPVLYWQTTERLIEPAASSVLDSIEVEGLGIRISQRSESAPSHLTALPEERPRP